MDNSKFIPSQPEVEPKPKSKTELIKFFIIASVLLVFGIGGALATKVWNPWWNPFRPSPNKVIEKMTKAMEGVKTVHSKMEFEITAFENGEKTAGFKGSMEGDSDVQDLEKPKADVKFDFDIRTEGSEYFIGFELRQTAKDLYFKPKTLPVFLTQIVLPMAGIDWQELQNQWIRVNASELEKMYPDLFPQKEESQEHQQDIQNKLKEMIENKKFYLVKKTLPDEQINGKDSYHYLVALDREAIKQIISDMVFSEEFKNEMGQAVEIEKEEILKNLDQFFEKMGELEAEVWIGKKDYYLYKSKVEISIDLEKTTEEFEASGDKEIVVFKLDMENSNYNTPLSIEAPKNYKKLEEILTGYFDYLEEARKEAVQARIIVDMSQIRSEAEIFWLTNESYTGVCSHKDIINMKNDIIDQKGANYSCYAGANSYCVEVQLPSGKWWCVDSDLVSREFNQNPACSAVYMKCE